MKTNYKSVLMILVAFVLCLCAACGGNEQPVSTDAVVQDDTATPTATVAATIAATPTPAITPVPTPEITLEPVIAPPDVELTEGGFKTLAKDSDVVVMGRFVKNNGIINMWNPGGKVDITKPIPSTFPRDGKTTYMGEYQFDFIVDKVYKGKDLKAEQQILVHLFYESQMKGKALVKEELFVMPDLDQQYVMFLSKDADYSLYYPDVNPSMFKLDDNNTLYIVTGIQGQAEYWEKGAGLKGIPLSQFEKAVK